MRRCLNCVYCRKDMVAKYVKGIDYCVCDLTGDVILDPWFERCGSYRKDNFTKEGFVKWLKDVIRR